VAFVFRAEQVPYFADCKRDVVDEFQEFSAGNINLASGTGIETVLPP
jgi:hypothetical protein